MKTKIEKPITKEQMEREEAAGVNEGWLDAEVVTADEVTEPIADTIEGVCDSERLPDEGYEQAVPSIDMNEIKRVLRLLVEAVEYAAVGKKIGPRTSQIMKSRVRSGRILLRNLGES